MVILSATPAENSSTSLADFALFFTSGVVICVVSTYFVVGHLIRLDKSELYY